MTFWWWSFPLSKGLRPCEDLRTSWSGEIRMLSCILTSRNTIFLKRRKLICCSWPLSRGWVSCIFNVSSECSLLLSKRDFFVLLCCNTQSYCTREHFVTLLYFWIWIKVTLFLVFLHVLTSFCIKNQTSRSDYLWFDRNVTF